MSSTNTILPRPEVTPPRSWAFPRGLTVVLPNGLTVVAHHLPGKQIVALKLLLDLGSEAEPAGLEGLANITISALAEGTTSYDAHGFAVARSRLGASYQAGCGSETGTITMTVPVSKLEAGLDLLAEAVLRPTFPAPEIDRLVKQRLNGITNELSSPSNRASLELAKAFYVASSRRSKPGRGSAESVARIDREAARGFYVQQADSATTTLVVAGDLSGYALEDLVAARFGEWLSVGRTAAPVKAAELAGEPRVIIVDRPGAVQTQLLLAAPAVTMNDPDLPPISLSAHVLGGGMESRIMSVLREEKGYIYSMNASASGGRSDGRFVVSGAVQTEVTRPAVADLLAILRGYAADGIRESERVAAVEKLAGGAPLSYDTSQAVAGATASMIANGLPDSYVDDQLAALRATTVDGVNSAFARGVALDRAVLVAVGDAAIITDSLRGTGLGDVTVVPA